VTRLEKGLLHGSAALVAASGIAYAAFKYFMTSDDPFSAVGHPLQPWALRVHVLAAPALVFAVGMILKDHVLGKLKNGSPPAARRGGSAALAVFLFLAATGYILQVLVSGTARTWTGWTHAAAGVLFVLAYAAHLATTPSRTPARNGAGAGEPGRGATVTGLRIAGPGGAAPRDGRWARRPGP
jgi:hypothetical protein